MKFLIIIIISFLLTDINQSAMAHSIKDRLIAEREDFIMTVERKSIPVIHIEDNVVVTIVGFADDYDFEANPLFFEVVDNVASGYMLIPDGWVIGVEVAVGAIYDPATGLFTIPPLTEEENIAAIESERRKQNLYALELLYPSLYMASSIEDVLRESLRLEYVKEKDVISESDIILQDEVGATFDTMRRTDYITYKALEDGTLLEDIDWLLTYDETEVLERSDIPDVPDK